ncbi:MAG: hypothetical protein NVS2B12_02470 [Ktedonobacteraceae bacterium]
MIATDPLSLLFVGCFLLGLLYLLLTAFVGMGHSHSHGVGHGISHGIVHHVDAQPHLHGSAQHHVHIVGQGDTHHNADGPHFSLFAYLNPTSVVLFLLGFGFFGYLLHNTTTFALPVLLLLALVSGFIVAGLLLMLLARLFGDSEAATVQDVSDRTGLLGKVSITIQENNIGEILYVSPGGMRKSIPARSVDGRRLERDQEVVVVNYQRGVAEVDTWEHFVNHEGSAASTPEVDDLATLRALLEEPDKADSEYVTRNESPKE